MSTSSAGRPRNHPPSSGCSMRQTPHTCVPARGLHASQASSIGPIWTYTLSPIATKLARLICPEAGRKRPCPRTSRKGRRDDGCDSVWVWHLRPSRLCVGRALRSRRPVHPRRRRPVRALRSTRPAASRRPAAGPAEPIAPDPARCRNSAGCRSQTRYPRPSQKRHLSPRHRRIARLPKPGAPAEGSRRCAMEPPATWTLARDRRRQGALHRGSERLDAVLIPRNPSRRSVRYARAHRPYAPRVARGHLHARRPHQLRHAAPLNTWITKDLQPLGPAAARRQDRQDRGDERLLVPHRLRAGRPTSFAEHAYVDALDIRGFVTTKSEDVVVLSSWGAMTRGDVIAAAAAKAKEEQLAAAQTDAVNAQRDNLRDGKPGQAEQSIASPTATLARHAGTASVKASPRPTTSTRCRSIHPIPDGKSRTSSAPRRPRRQVLADAGKSPEKTPQARPCCRRSAGFSAATPCPIPARRSSCARRTPPPAASSARRSARKPTKRTATTSTSTWPSANGAYLRIKIWHASSNAPVLASDLPNLAPRGQVRRQSSLPWTPSSMPTRRPSSATVVRKPCCRGLIRLSARSDAPTPSHAVVAAPRRRASASASTT